MTEKKKTILKKIYYSTLTSVVGILVVLMINWMVKQGKLYAQVTQMPQKVEKLEKIVDKIKKNNDSIINCFTDHNAIQIMQVQNINNNLEENKVALVKQNEKLDQILILLIQNKNK